MRGSRSLAILRSILEQLKLPGIARGSGKPEVPERVRGQQPAAWRALQKPALDQERLDDVLDRVARLGQRGRERLDPDRSAAVMHGDRREIAAVHGPQARHIDFQGPAPPVGGGPDAPAAAGHRGATPPPPPPPPPRPPPAAPPA